MTLQLALNVDDFQANAGNADFAYLLMDVGQFIESASLQNVQRENIIEDDEEYLVLTFSSDKDVMTFKMRFSDHFAQWPLPPVDGDAWDDELDRQELDNMLQTLSTILSDMDGDALSQALEELAEDY